MITWTNEKRKLRDLIPWERNPREINTKEAERLGDSLEEFGQIQTIAIDPNDEILDGHQRKAVWSLLPQFGPEHEVDVRVSSRELTEKERQKLVVYLHRGTNANWDWDLLADTFEVEDLLEWGFDESELQLDWGSEEPAPDPGAQVDKAAELQEKWQVDRGQIWQAGEHVVICGDCREPDTWTRLLKAASIEKVNGVFTSPPYAEQRKKQYGGVPVDKYVEWWDAVQSNVRGSLANDGSFFVNIKPHCEDGQRVLYVFDLVLAMVRRWVWRFVDELCWTHQGVPGYWNNRFKNGFEPIFQFVIDNAIKFRPKNVSHKDETAFKGKGGGLASYYDPDNAIENSTKAFFGDVLPANSMRLNFPSATKEFTGHGAQFPVSLPDFFIRAYSDPGDVWVDNFVGSGTTIVAAHQNDRRGLGIEKLPKYVAVTLERLQGIGLEPRLIED